MPRMNIAVRVIFALVALSRLVELRLATWDLGGGGGLKELECLACLQSLRVVQPDAVCEVGGSTPGLSHGDLGIFLGGGQTEEFVH